LIPFTIIHEALKFLNVSGDAVMIAGSADLIPRVLR
jgi:hypothetical protein